MLLRDDADDLGGAPASVVLDHHRRRGVAARHALNDVEHDVRFARDGEIALCNVAKADSAAAAIKPSLQRRLDGPEFDAVYTIQAAWLDGKPLIATIAGV